MHAYMPRIGSRQESLNKLICFTLLGYLLCSGDYMYSVSWVNWPLSTIFYVFFFVHEVGLKHKLTPK